MNIPTSEIHRYIHPDATCVSIRQDDGSPCREISLENLKVLIARGYVIGIPRGRKLKEIRLTVGPDVAFRELGETRQRVKDCVHTDANRTTLRADEGKARHQRKHNNAVCLGRNPAHFGWNGPVPNEKGV